MRAAGGARSPARPATPRRSAARRTARRPSAWIGTPLRRASSTPDRGRARASAPRSSSRRCRTCCRLRDPTRDTVLYPGGRRTRPTRWARRSPGCGPCRCRSTRAGTSTSAPIATPTPSARCVLWLNDPANPTGVGADRAEMQAAVEWARSRGVIVASDECYAEFTYDDAATAPPVTALDAGVDGVLAVHSLSKRSNMAGLRVGFFAGDAESRPLPGRDPQARRADDARCRSRPRRRLRSATTRTSTSSEPGTRRARERLAPALERLGSRARRRSVDLLPVAARRRRAPTTAGRSPARLAATGPARRARRSLRRRRAPTTCASRSAFTDDRLDLTIERLGA